MHPVGYDALDEKCEVVYGQVEEEKVKAENCAPENSFPSVGWWRLLEWKQEHFGVEVVRGDGEWQNSLLLSTR